MRSIWRSSFASSPEMLAPRRSGTSRSLARRSRSRSCSISVGLGSAAIGEEREEPADERPELPPLDDRVHVPEAAVRLGEAKAVRKLPPRRLRDAARAGEGKEGAGLGHDHVAEAREAREHAGGRRVGHDADEGGARLAQLIDRADRLRELHEREDPLLHASAAGGRHDDERDAAGASHGARTGELLADPAPPPAAHESEVHDRELAGAPLDGRGAGDEGVTEAGRDLGLGEALRVRAKVEEPEWVGGAKAGVFLDERALVGELRDALTRPNGEVVAALRADPERLLELLVSVVGVALRARVRMLRALAHRGRAALLDRHVDPTRHRAYLTGPPPYSPSAAAKRSSGAAFSGSGRRPVKPAPITGPAAAMRSRGPAVSATVGPPGSGAKTATPADGSTTSTS